MPQVRDRAADSGTCPMSLHSPVADLTFCEKCGEWTTHADDACAICKVPTDMAVRMLQCAEAFCRGCRRRQIHRVRSATLITCVVCLLPQEYEIG